MRKERPGNIWNGRICEKLCASDSLSPGTECWNVNLDCSEIIRAVFGRTADFKFNEPSFEGHKENNGKEPND